MPNLALKKTKEIITACCLVALSLAFTTHAYALGARGELTCYNSCRNYSIETPADHYTEDQAAENLYRDALAFCSDKGGLASHKVESFFSAENIQLSGTSWEVTDYNDGRELVDIKSYQKLDIRFEEDGTVHGASFCNDYAGYYTVSEDKISMRPVATFALCEGLMRQEELFRDAARYETRGDQLILEDDNGTVVALLARK